MAGKSPSRAQSTSPLGQVMLMLDEIRAQNAATLDAVLASSGEIRRDMKRQEGPAHHKVDLAKIEALERRVAALEV